MNIFTENDKIILYIQWENNNALTELENYCYILTWLRSEFKFSKTEKMYALILS
jgi:hypothetical protein